MSTEQNKQLVLRWKEAFWNGTGDLNLVDEFFAPDIVSHMAGMPEPIRGREAFKQLLASLTGGFGDIHDTPELLVAEGDLVVIREMARARHTGPFQGIPPTGKEVTVTNNEINRIVDRKIVEQWAGFDMFSLMQQIGAIPMRLAEASGTAAIDDVFWLNANELELAAHALDMHEPLPDYRAAVSGRRALWARERGVTPPVHLPLKEGERFWGIDWSFASPARTSQGTGNNIKGVGASPGVIRGIAQVIREPDEFSRMQPNSILVAKITTPAWTPLFALASGVVTDVGGLLSHSSIVAREYRIPAVVGTGVATERIRSGQPITVDGDRGWVML